MAKPWFIVLVGLGVAGWIAANLIASVLGLQAIDAPAFPWLQGAANLFSLFVVMLVLVAQKHEDELNAHRDTLTLELAILSEHKIAKVIQLLEELRRDSPHVQDGWIRKRSKWREPADAGSVLAAARANNGIVTLGPRRSVRAEAVSGNKCRTRSVWKPRAFDAPARASGNSICKFATALMLRSILRNRRQFSP